MSALKVIQLGVGGRGRAFLKALVDDGDFTHAAYVDPNPASMAEAQTIKPLDERLCYSDMERALAEVEADAVFVVTPPHLHTAHCRAALSAGKHVLVEKPFTKSLAEAREIVEMAERLGLTLVVSQNARYAARVQRARELIEGSAYGRVCAGTVIKLGYRARVHHSGEDAHSYLWERGVHDVDTLLHLMRPQVARRASARSFNPPFSPYKGGASAYGWVEFDGGAVVDLNLSFMSHMKRNEIMLECEEATVRLDGGLTVHRTDAEPETIEVDAGRYRDSVRCVLDSFRDGITKGQEALTSGRANLQTIAVIEALGRSSTENAVMDASV